MSHPKFRLGNVDTDNAEGSRSFDVDLSPDQQSAIMSFVLQSIIEFERSTFESNLSDGLSTEFDVVQFDTNDNRRLLTPSRRWNVPKDVVGWVRRSGIVPRRGLDPVETLRWP